MLTCTFNGWIILWTKGRVPSKRPPPTFPRNLCLRRGGRLQGTLQYFQTCVSTETIFRLSYVCLLAPLHMYTRTKNMGTFAWYSVLQIPSKLSVSPITDTKTCSTEWRNKKQKQHSNQYCLSYWLVLFTACRNPCNINRKCSGFLFVCLLQQYKSWNCKLTNILKCWPCTRRSKDAKPRLKNQDIIRNSSRESPL